MTRRPLRIPFRIRRRLTSSRWHPFDAFESRIVWLLGSPRSGSTWLFNLLAADPHVVGVNEPHIGLYLGPFMSDLPGFAPGSLDADSFTIRRLQAGHGETMFADEHADVWGPDLNRLITNRLRAQVVRTPDAGRFRRTLAVVKEPSGSQSADILLQVQPRSRLLFLLRDGRDVVDSELAANRVGSWVGAVFPGFDGVGPEERLAFVTQSACKWLWRTEVVEQAYRTHPGPKLLVRYEDILREPRAQLGQIIDWLGLHWSDAELEAQLERRSFLNIPEAQRGEQQFFRSAAPGRWVKNLLPAERAEVMRILGPKLAELGYDVEDPTDPLEV